MEECMEENNDKRAGADGSYGGLSKRTQHMCELIKFVYEHPFLTTTELQKSIKCYTDMDIRSIQYDIKNLISLELFKTIDNKICFYDYTNFEYELDKLYNLSEDLYPNATVPQKMKISFAKMFRQQVTSGVMVNKIMKMIIELIGFEYNLDTISRFKKYTKLRNKECIFAEGQSNH